jgi:hypothetical protein
MKISTHPDYPNYHDWADRVCRFILAGSERNNVLHADEERRYAITLKLDAKGNPKTSSSGQAQTEEFRGSVVIECPAWLRHEADNGGSPQAYLPI